MRRMMGVAALALGVLVCGARAEIRDLLPRLPDDANAVVAVDIAAVLNSPIGKTLGWGSSEGGLPVVQLGATRALVATRVNLSTMDSDWEVAVFEMNKPPSMSGIALSEGGFVDTVANLPAAWSSRKMYFLALDKQILGAAMPDDRQFTTRWARQQVGASKPIISTYLQEAALQASSKSPVVMAFDLQDAVGLNKVRKALSSDLSRASLLKDTPVDNVAQLLTTIKGVVVKMQFGNDITGQIVVDFGKDPSMISAVALPLLKDVLTNNGLGLSDLDTWDVSTEGNKLIYSGKLTPAGFMKAMTLVEVPSPNSTDAPSPAASGATLSSPGNSATPATPADPQAATIKASQAYFKAISATLDSFSQPASAGAGAAWLKRAATRIDHLPMLNVDPELVQWGTSVSASLMNCAQQLAVGQTSISATAAGAYGANMGSASNYYQDSYGNYVYNDQQIRADHAKQVAAMQQATQAERARVVAPVADLLSQTIASRSRMRATLVARYKVEF